MPQHFDGPETAAMIADVWRETGRGTGLVLTEAEAKVLERSLANAARSYGRARERVRRLKLALRAAERDVKSIRRDMRLMISARTK